MPDEQPIVFVVAGRLSKHIAGELQLSEVTVKVHRGQVMRKMGGATLADLIGLAGKLAR